MLLPDAVALAAPLEREFITPRRSFRGRRAEVTGKNFSRFGVRLREYYLPSTTSVSGRSLPAAVSVCHLPSDVSYSMSSVRPGTRCSAAACLAAATGALWAANNGGALLKTLRDKEQGTKP